MVFSSMAGTHYLETWKYLKVILALTLVFYNYDVNSEDNKQDEENVINQENTIPYQETVHLAPFKA